MRKSFLEHLEEYLNNLAKDIAEETMWSDADDDDKIPF